MKIAPPTINNREILFVRKTSQNGETIFYTDGTYDNCVNTSSSPSLWIIDEDGLKFQHPGMDFFKLWADCRYMSRGEVHILTDNLLRAAIERELL